MNIYTLTRRGGADARAKAGCYRKIVRAANANEARRIANRDVGKEGHIWTRHEYVRCNKVRLAGRPVVLCEDHYG